jgi:hypothetical protein
MFSQALSNEHSDENFGMQEFYTGKHFKNKVKSFPAADPILDITEPAENALNDEKSTRTAARLQMSPRKPWT